MIIHIHFRTVASSKQATLELLVIWWTVLTSFLQRWEGGCSKLQAHSSCPEHGVILLMVRAMWAMSQASVRMEMFFSKVTLGLWWRSLPPGFQGRQLAHCPFLLLLYPSGHFFRPFSWQRQMFDAMNTETELSRILKTMEIVWLE